MGRSVSYPPNTATVCFRDVTWFGQVNEDGDFDEDQVTEDWNWFVQNIVDTAKEKWPSFAECDEWIAREDKAILENNFAYIGVSEYGGLAAVWLLPKTEKLLVTGYEDDAKIANLADGWCKRIVGNFDKLFGEYVKTGTMSNGESVYKKIA